MPKQGFIRGRVSFGAQEVYRVLLPIGQNAGSGEIPAEPSGALRAYAELPAVGDWVWVRPAGEFCLIEEVEARRTAFVRRAAGKTHAAQCVAANIDVCFVVCGLDGDFNLRRVERYLVLVRESGARPVLVLNKQDICADIEAARHEVGPAAAGAEVVVLSARQSVEPLMPWLRPGVTVALLGSSGAGKSTIANGLTGRDLATNEVRMHDSRGRHTTTASMLIALPGGAWLIDTPGMRELGLLASDAAVDSGFPEIAALSEKCRFRDCRHEQEPGCAVRLAFDQGRIPHDRWASYTKLLREVRHNALEADATAQRAEKQKWKAIHKRQKQLYRDRGR